MIYQELWMNLAKEYGLSSLNPVKNLSYHYVLAGFRGYQPIILKLGLDIDDLKKESTALKIFSKFGGVKVLAESTGLLLVERAISNISLT